MKWFEGTIPEAIGAAKSRNAIFVVYVHDSSEASKATDETLAHKDITEALGSENFVAIQLENGTAGAKQFSQIYPLVLVPSLFFISGQTGIPLEVLGGPLVVEHLLQKLNKLVPSLEQETSTSSAVDENSPPSSNCESSQPVVVVDHEEQHQDETPMATEDLQTEEPELLLDSKDEATVEADSATEPQDNCMPEASAAEAAEVRDDDETSKKQDLEERVERAKLLLAQKQAKEAQEKAEEERQKEMERRKTGQEVNKKRQQQQDAELKAIVRDFKKDKEEDRLAREKVRAQIAADRVEHEARAALFSGEQASSSQESASVCNASPASSPATSDNSTSRLKFRLPNGSSNIARFPAETTLAEVRQHIQQNIQLPFSRFHLASTVHHRPFTTEDYNTTLRDLGLVPSAIIFILSTSAGDGGSVVPSFGGIWDLFWILLSPVTFLLRLVRQFIGGSTDPRTPPPSPDEPEVKRPREDGSSQQRPATAYGRRGDIRVRREGNIHRLGNNDDDDDDENNTWNGNSTQQM